MKSSPFRSFSLIACLSLFCTGIFSASAQEAEEVYKINLKNVRLTPSENGGKWLDSFGKSKTNAPAQVIIQFFEIPTEATRAKLGAAGIRLFDYMGGRAFSALIAARKSDGLNQLNEIRAIIPVLAAWKMDPSIRNSLSAKGNVSVLVSFLAGTTQEEILQWIEQKGGKLIGKMPGNSQNYKVSLPAKNLSAFADWYGVKYIGLVPDIQPLNFESRNATKASWGTLPVQFGGEGLNGSGITVGVGDVSPAMYHIDLTDRVLNFHPGGDQHHGHHTNGTVGGAGIVDPHGEGFAPAVQLIDHLYDLVLYNTPGMYARYQMSLTNNSYAAVVGNCSYAGTYDGLAQELDDLAKQMPNVLHVFASGNDGGMTCGSFSAGFGTVTGGYQPAKNVLVVGNVEKSLGLRAASSRGPVKDGRLKPEICAIGTNVFSTIGNDAYILGTGTSMAAPNVTGALALLSQKYKLLHGGVLPSAEVLKCLIVNGATDMGNPGPDYSFGFGLMNLYRSFQMLDNNRYVTNTVNNGGQNTFTLTVPANTAQLKVMLYYHDTSANVLAATQLVNDLDLELVEPSSTVHLPLILNPSPSSVNNNAVEGADRLNNIEQVVINNPAAGTYTVRVKGYNITYPNQSYAVAYDYVPVGVQLMFPMPGAVHQANDSMHIYWEASPDTNPFTLEFSSDNGSTWTVLSNNIASTARVYSWLSPNISSQLCKFRLTRNNTSQQVVSSSFVINPAPAVQLVATQCPGYFSFNWNAIPNATKYEILMKKGIGLKTIDTVTATSYIIKGLSLDSTYYVAVRPFINNVPGWRSNAIKRKPNDGNCGGGISDGDMMTEQITGPTSGRLHTSSELTSSQTLSVKVRNLDDVAVNNYRISWKVNAGAWQSQTFTNPIAANSSSIVNIPGFNFQNVGSYAVKVAVQNLATTDPVKGNDTTVATIRQLKNDTLNIDNGFIEDFESAGPDSYTIDTIGLLANDHWDFSNTNDSGRIAFSKSPDIVISGSHSASMDSKVLISTAGNNYLTGTFNVARYDTTSDEVRLEFDYKMHGKPKTAAGNQVWIRGSDQAPWVNLFNYNTNVVAGLVNNSGSISLTTALIQNHQNFSASTQLRFGQNDTAVIAANDYGNGVTIDNVKLYTVKNDVELLSVVSPHISGCNLGSQEPLTVQVYNNYNQPQTNVQMYYQLDGGSIVHETLSSIAAKDTILFTFNNHLNLSALGVHDLNVWLVANGDTYLRNDSIMHYMIRSQPVVASFPYLEDFESGDGYWYTTGKNTSWQYGTPASKNVTHAASGTKAWKTNLSGYYNNSEQSYLISPCIDVTGLANPMLSFSTAMDIENCGNSLCDAGYLEYATGDNNWVKLGAAGEGTNWYDSTFQVWNQEGFTRWHVASIPLPKVNGTFRLRFVLHSDPGAGKEGIAIDDIHIFDRVYSVFEDSVTSPVVQNVGSGQIVNFTSSGKILAQMQGVNQDPGKTDLSLYAHTNMFNRNSSQYFLPRNFVINPENTVSDSVLVRLYIGENSVVDMVNATGCNECATPESAYTLGVTKYHDPVKANENGSLDDNLKGMYSYIPRQKIRWVPYDNGYYAEFKLQSFSELWFNDGGPTNHFNVTEAPVDFEARKISPQFVSTTWTTTIDTAVYTYELQRGNGLDSFHTIYTQAAAHQPTATYNYTDTPVVDLGNTLYYRVKYTLNNNKVYYTYVRRVDWTAPDQLIAVFPNPVENGQLNIKWSANVGTELKASVCDVAGKIVWRNQATASEWNNTTTINLTGLGTGIYLVKITIGDNRFVEKVLVKQ